MSFIDKVNTVKQNVFNNPEYATAIKEIMNRATKYSAQKSLEESLKREENDLTI